MDREDIIRMAREAGSSPAQIDIVWRFAAVFDDFATLVAAAEREACAKFVEDEWRHEASQYAHRLGCSPCPVAAPHGAGGIRPLGSSPPHQSRLRQAGTHLLPASPRRSR